jgi:hypothetical protein
LKTVKQTIVATIIGYKIYFNEVLAIDNLSTRVSIDTLILVAKLTDLQLEFIYDRLVLDKKNQFQDKSFNYCVRIGNIIIKTMPKKSWTYTNYNSMIIITKNTSSTYIPYSIKEILQFKEWKFKRLDIAFDSNEPFNKSVILKHHGNLKLNEHNSEDWMTNYLHNIKSKTEVKVANYDRNEKELEYDNEFEHEYPNRFEVRLFPKLNEFNFIHNPDHGWIQNKLEKYIYLLNIDNLQTNKWNIRKLDKLRQDYNYWNELDTRKQQELKELGKNNRVPFENIYTENKIRLFSFLDIESLRVPQLYINNLSYNKIS